MIQRFIELIYKEIKEYQEKLKENDMFRNIWVENIQELKILKKIFEERDRDFKNGDFVHPRDCTSISYILRDGDFTKKEIFELLIIFFKYNISVLNIQKPQLDLDMLNSYKFKYGTLEEFISIINAGKNIVVEIHGIPKNNEERKHLEYAELLKKCTKGNSTISSQYLIIKEHYFDKYPLIDGNDLQLLTKALKELHLNRSLIGSFASHLYTEIKERERITNNQELSDFISSLQTNIKLKFSQAKNNVQELKVFSECLDEVEDSVELMAFITEPSKTHTSRTIFSNFNLLCNRLNNISKSSQINIIFYIIERNIQNGLLDSNITLNNNYAFGLANLARKEMFYTFDSLRSYTENFLSFEEDKDKINTKPIEINENELEVFRTSHQAIFNHYLVKKDSYTEEDVVIVINALSALGIPENMLIRIDRFLRKPIAKTEEVVIEKVNIELKPIMSRKEYNKIYNELLEYFDFNSMLPIRYLTLDEIIYCIHILHILNFDDNTIQKFIKEQEKYNRKSDINPIIRYLDLKSKMEYYKENERVMEILNELDETFSKTFIYDNEDDYEFYKEYMGMELERIDNLLSTSHEYEYTLARKLDNK